MTTWLWFLPLLLMMQSKVLWWVSCPHKGKAAIHSENTYIGKQEQMGCSTFHLMLVIPKEQQFWGFCLSLPSYYFPGCLNEFHVLYKDNAAISTYTRKNEQMHCCTFLSKFFFFSLMCSDEFHVVFEGNPLRIHTKKNMNKRVQYISFHEHVKSCPQDWYPPPTNLF